MDAVTLAMIKGLGGGGSSLPSVTSSDNGKVLGVVNGAWAADANTFVITASGSPATVDKTIDEILAALDAGKAVYLFDGSRTFAYLGKDSTNIYFATESATTSRYYAYIALSNAKYTIASYPKLPAVYSSDNGSELIVKNGYWAKQKKKFVVTLTPTSPDYSGTMDKTVAEINAAYEAGQEIWFKLEASGMGYLMEMAGIGNCDPESTYPSFNVKFLANNTLLYVNSVYTNDGTKQTYSTEAFALTPAS